jgi:hypothetical protein
MWLPIHYTDHQAKIHAYVDKLELVRPASWPTWSEVRSPRIPSCSPPNRLTIPSHYDIRRYSHVPLARCALAQPQTRNSKIPLNSPWSKPWCAILAHAQTSKPRLLNPGYSSCSNREDLISRVSGWDEANRPSWWKYRYMPDQGEYYCIVDWGCWHTPSNIPCYDLRQLRNGCQMCLVRNWWNV